MARAKNKKELIESSNSSFNKLFEFIDTMTDEELNTEFDFSNDDRKKEKHWSRDKNLRDVLIHLYCWHELLIDFVEKNTSGIESKFLPEGYNWKNYSEMNVKFWQDHQNTSLDDSKEMLKQTHKKVMDLIEKFTDEELFTKKYYPWTNTTTLGSYFVSSTDSHYNWAIKKLKEHRKKLNKKN